MATNRSYNDLCGLAHSLDLVGERWALLIVRELLLGPRRYTDLDADLPGVSSNVLAQRLAGLVTSGVLVRRELPPPAASTVYELTDWGRQLEPIVVQLARWGMRSPGHPAGEHLSGTSLMLSLRGNILPATAATGDVSLELVMNDERFHARIRDGALTNGRGPHPDGHVPEAVVTAAPMTLAVLVYGDGDLTAATGSGGVTVEGDTTAVDRFVTRFALPATAASPALGG